MTVRDLINGSMRLLGVLASGEVATAAEAQDSLAALNSMLDSWSTERLSVMSTTQRDVTLTTSKPAYTIGTGGDIDIPRPQQVYDVSVAFPSGPGDSFIALDELTLDQYSSYTYIAYQTPIPQSFYIDTDFPFTRINFIGQPQAGTRIRFWTWDVLTGAASLDTVLATPPGYEKAYRYNLAIDLAPEFGVQPPAAVVANAQVSKDNIQRMNVQDISLSCDPALVSPTGGSFNRYIG